MFSVSCLCIALFYSEKKNKNLMQKCNYCIAFCAVIVVLEVLRNRVFKTM